MRIEGRRDQKGLIVWKKYDRQLSPQEIKKERENLENEGFEIIAVKNSQTVIVAVTSEGLAYSTSRLRKIDYEWERCLETHNQLNSKAKAKLLELVRENPLRGREWGLRNTEGSGDRSGRE